MSLSGLVSARSDEMGEYHDVATAACFGDSGAEWEALNSGVALLDRSYRRTLRAVGEDCRRFLHGQLSSDVASLQSGGGQPTLLLNAQGRVQSILALYDRGEHFDLVVDADLVDASKERLEQFLVADDVEFSVVDESESIQLGVGGPKAAAVLSKAGIEVPQDAWGVAGSRVDGRDVLVYSRGDLRVRVYEIACDNADALWEGLESLGASPTGFQAVETVRVESGSPRFGVDVGPDRIAMEARLEWAIHFSKGCYVGQEVIERAVSRGRLNRQLCLLELEGVPALGAAVEGAGENDVVTSLARSPKYGHVALAYVDRDRAVAGVRLHVGGVPARVLEWPRQETLAGR